MAPRNTSPPQTAYSCQALALRLHCIVSFRSLNTVLPGASTEHLCQIPPFVNGHRCSSIIGPDNLKQTRERRGLINYRSSKPIRSVFLEPRPIVTHFASKICACLMPLRVMLTFCVIGQCLCCNLRVPGPYGHALGSAITVTWHNVAGSWLRWAWEGGILLSHHHGSTQVNQCVDLVPVRFPVLKLDKSSPVALAHGSIAVRTLTISLAQGCAVLKGIGDVMHQKGALRQFRRPIHRRHRQRSGSTVRRGKVALGAYGGESRPSISAKEGRKHGLAAGLMLGQVHQAQARIEGHLVPSFHFRFVPFIPSPNGVHRQSPRPLHRNWY